MTWPKRIFLVGVILVFLGILAGVGGVIGIFWWYGRGVSELDEARLKNYAPPQITRIYANDGTLIGEVFEQRRTLVRYEEIPSHVENAFLAAEDADFYRHEGMDYTGMVRALLVNVRARRVKQGASTITQQVVKNFMLTPERSLERKVQELILARRLEQALTKQEILELYLNEIYLGHGRYGLEEAAQYYFAKSVRDIDLGQAALLATLPKAPSRDSPYKSPDKAKERQVWVLQQMVEHGFATADDAQPFIDGPLDVATPQQRKRVVAGAEEFVDQAERWLKEQYGDGLATLGGAVTTTVDLRVQGQARIDLIAALHALDVRQGYGAETRVATKRQLKAAAKDGNKSMVVGRTYRAIAIAPDGVALPANSYAAQVGELRLVVSVPKGPRFRKQGVTLAEQFVPDVVHPVLVQSLSEPALPQGWGRAKVIVPESAVAVSDPQTGHVVAMIGGSSYERGQFNRVLQAARQPGSSFKPFVYGAAVQSKQYTAATLVSDSPEIYEKWQPTNFLRDVYLGDVRLRLALTKSINTIAIKLLDTVGYPAVHQFAYAAGIETTLPEHLSLALGTTEIRPIEMLTGYTTLARGGSRITPRFIDRVEAPGRNPDKPEQLAEQTLERDAVYVLVSMMTSVVRSGTGAKARALGRPAAGKTGTSADFHDAWFCGFTADKVAVAWVGFDSPRYLGKGETGGKAAIPVWLGAMRAAHTTPPRPFDVPEGVVVHRIDSQSGLLAPTWDVDYGGTDKRKTLDEYFIKGTAPVDYAVPAALPKGDVVLDLYGDADGVNSASDDPDALLDADPDFADDAGSTADPALDTGGTPKPLPRLDETYDGDADYDPDGSEPAKPTPAERRPDDGLPSVND